MSTTQGFTTPPMIGARRSTPVPSGNVVPLPAKERNRLVDAMVRKDSRFTRDHLLVTSDLARMMREARS
jgi:hypothetical protein